VDPQVQPGHAAPGRELPQAPQAPVQQVSVAQLCVCVCTQTHEDIVFTQTSPLLPQGVAEGAHALLPETGGDRRTCRSCPERGRQQVSDADTHTHTHTGSITEVPCDPLTPSTPCINVFVLRDVAIWMPEMEQQEVPARWWDTEADCSLLAGVYKHGGFSLVPSSRDYYPPPHTHTHTPRFSRLQPLSVKPG